MDDAGAFLRFIRAQLGRDRENGGWARRERATSWRRCEDGRTGIEAKPTNQLLFNWNVRASAPGQVKWLTGSSGRGISSTVTACSAYRSQSHGSTRSPEQQQLQAQLREISSDKIGGLQAKLLKIEKETGEAKETERSGCGRK